MTSDWMGIFVVGYLPLVLVLLAWEVIKDLLR